MDNPDRPDPEAAGDAWQIGRKRIFTVNIRMPCPQNVTAPGSLPASCTVGDYCCRTSAIRVFTAHRFAMFRYDWV